MCSCLVGDPVLHKSNVNDLISMSLLKLKFLNCLSFTSVWHTYEHKEIWYLPPQLFSTSFPICSPQGHHSNNVLCKQQLAKILKSLLQQIWHTVTQMLCHCDTCILSFFKKLFPPGNVHQGNWARKLRVFLEGLTHLWLKTESVFVLAAGDTGAELQAEPGPTPGGPRERPSAPCCSLGSC